MSRDIVDDLEAAEDNAAVYRSMLAELLEALDAADEGTDDRAGIDAIRERCRRAIKDQACRPTCEFRTTGYCHDDDPDCCGCPCGHEHDRTTRLLAYLDEYAARGVNHPIPPADEGGCQEGQRWLLLEENVRGGWWLSTFDSKSAAADYHVNQEYAGEWTNTELLVDLDTGRGYWPGRARMKWTPAGGPSACIPGLIPDLIDQEGEE